MNRPAAQHAHPAPDAKTVGDGPDRRWRFALVLLTALLVSAGQPLASKLLGDRDSFDVGVTLLIAAVLLLALEPGGYRRAAISLGVASFACLWIGHIAEGGASSALIVVAHALTTCLFGLVLVTIIRTILVGRASGNAVLAAVCGYLLVGIIWSLIYSAVETAAPDSFHVQSRSGDRTLNVAADRSALGYFSFVTLSTVGYGDVTPTTRLARTFAWMEAVTGQFYLAVIVAGLVGFKVAQGQRQSPDDEAADRSAS